MWVIYLTKRYSMLLIVCVQIIWFADYPYTIVSCKWLMTKVGNDMIYHGVLEQNPEYKQKSWTIYVNNKPKQ
jgi:hypothetical protein